MGVITFSIAAILSLPKQFITVYLGVALEQSEDGKSSKSDTIIKDVVLGATTLITIGAMWYIYHKMNQAKPMVIYDRRKARQAKLAPYGGGGSSPAMLESTVSVAFTPTPAVSTVDIPLTKYGQPQSQGGVYAPQPRRASQPGGEQHQYQYQYPMSQYDNGNPALPPGVGYPYSSQGLPSHSRTHGAPSPSSDPFSDSAPNYSKPQPHPQGVSYQRQGPPRGYGSPPPDTWDRRQPTHTPTQTPPAIRHQPPSAPHSPTVTQTQRGYPPPSGLPPPRSAPALASIHPNPFSDPSPMPNPYDRAGHGHGEEASDATLYTAAGGHSHSRGGTFDPDDAYDGASVHSREGSMDAAGHGGLRTAPPSYTSHAL